MALLVRSVSPVQVILFATLKFIILTSENIVSFLGGEVWLGTTQLFCTFYPLNSFHSIYLFIYWTNQSLVFFNSIRFLLRWSISVTDDWNNITLKWAIMTRGGSSHFKKEGSQPRVKGGFKLYAPIQMHWSAKQKGGSYPRNPPWIRHWV